MSKILFTAILSLSQFSFAFQTPMQTSAKINKMLIETLKSDSSLSFYSISKISIHDDMLKVELLDSQGNCKALPYELKRNELGATSIKLMIDAIAICDQ